MRSLMMIAALLGAAAYAAEDGGNAAAREARAELKTREGKRIGQVTLTQQPQGVLVRVELSGAPPGVHGFHIHETGRCEGNFDSAGGHFNPHGQQHGFGSAGGMHAGDLPNLDVPSSGELKVEFFVPQITLGEGKDSVLDRDGSAIVLHARADDLHTNPSGGSGERIACGVIQK